MKWSEQSPFSTPEPAARKTLTKGVQSVSDAHPNERARIAVNVLAHPAPSGGYSPTLPVCRGFSALKGTSVGVTLSCVHVSEPPGSRNDAVKEWITAYLDGGDQGLEHRFHRNYSAHAACGPS